MLSRLRTSAERFSSRVVTHPRTSLQTHQHAALAGQGAQVFIIATQLVLACVMFFGPDKDCQVRPRDRLIVRQDMFLLFATLWLAFNIAHRWTWKSDPGFVISAQDSCGHRGLRDGDGDPCTERRWCLFCELWQPLRSKHCALCGQCVRRFDHHCFWIATCVGERNHPRFLMMLFVHSMFLSATTVVLLQTVRLECGLWWNAVVISLLVCATSLAAMTFGLFVFHCALVATGRTTWELVSADSITYLRSRKERFRVGIVSNIRLFVFPPDDWNTIR
jgi:palmitoyltransferase